MEHYYDLIEASRILGVTVRTLRDWLKKGTLNAKKYNGKHKWFVSQSEIERLQNEMTKGE